MSQNSKKKYRPIKPTLIILGTFLLISVVFGSGLALITYGSYARDLATKDRLLNSSNTGVLLLDRNQEPFFTFYEARPKDYVQLSEIAEPVVEALLASEDKNFYQHDGFSPRAIAAAAVADLKLGELRYGGSTITQQLVKNALLGSEKSFLRKFQELILAKEIEKRFSKNEIIEMYLNSAYFGEGAFGIDQAARAYFNIPASELNLSQSTLLIGLLTAPSRLSPISGDRALAKERQAWVLTEMVENGTVDPDTAQAAANATLHFERGESDNLNSQAPHFALMVRDALISEFGEEDVIRSGFRVVTTLDLDWQHQAQEALSQNVNRIDHLGASNGAVVAIESSNGKVRALVGSVDWYNQEFGKVNMATAARQPGSSFKPIVYATALQEREITPATIIRDERITLSRNYTPTNYDNRFRGNVTARYALANSINVPAVKTIEMVSVQSVLETARSLGISTLGEPSQYGPSLALGSGEVPLIEMVGAYAAFANNGTYNEPLLIEEIRNKYGQTIQINKPSTHQAISEGVAFLISSMLSDERARRAVFGSSLDISRTAAVKTGTTQSYRDAWTIGYTPKLAVGVWIGNNNNDPMGSLPGSQGAAPVWRTLMEQYLAGTPEADFSPPPGIVSRRVCVPHAYSPITEFFLSGTEPPRDCHRVRTPPSPQPTPEGQTPSPESPQPEPSGPPEEIEELLERRREQRPNREDLERELEEMLQESELDD